VQCQSRIQAATKLIYVPDGHHPLTCWWYIHTATTFSIVIVPAFHAGTSPRCSPGGGGGGGGGQMMMMMINHHAPHRPPTQLEPHAHSWSKDSIVG